MMDGKRQNGRRWLASCALLGLLQGCSSLPDQDSANQALALGNYDQARMLYMALAERGFPDAQIALGDMYYQGIGIAENRTEGMQWYAQAAQSGDARALQRFAKSLTTLNAFHSSDPQRAKTLLLKLWDYEGKANVALDLGRLIVLFPKHGTAEEARRWLTMALDQQQLEANYYLGLLYAEGRLIDVDAVRARDYFVAALDESPLAAHELLKLYGEHPELGDLQTLLENLIARKSFEGGKSAYHLGQIFDRGELLPADPAKAEYFYLKALESYPKAILAMAGLYARNPVVDPERQVFEWIEKADAAGFKEQAQLLRARILYEGKLVPGEPEEAERLYLSLAERSAEACYHLGMLYRLGYLGESDYLQSFQYFLKAARMGYESADVQLGDMFTKGRVIRPDLARAVSHYRLAASVGHVRAEELLQSLQTQLSPDEQARASQWYSREAAIRMETFGQLAMAQTEGIRQ